MLLIEKLELEFQRGLNVLTGETGAGKSILLDNLGFVLGWRGRAEMVRQGASSGQVTAVFDLKDDHPAWRILEAAGFTFQPPELILRRSNARDGRKQAYVNDNRCSADVLRQLAEVLVEVHGQHDDRGLLAEAGHRALLDGFADNAQLIEAVRLAWRARSRAASELDKARIVVTKAREEEDFLRHAVAELAELAPEAGEDAALDSRRRLMQSAEKIRDDIVKGLELVGPSAAESSISDALNWLGGVQDQAAGQLDGPIGALGQALDELANAQRGIETCLQQLDFSASDLEQTEERLFAIRAAARKYGVSSEGLSAQAMTFSAQLAAIDAGDGQITDLESALLQAQTAYDNAAQRLSDVRKKSAKQLDSAMAKELKPLKLDRAIFTTLVQEADAGPSGKDRVAFSVATNPGAPSGPINKIASGGELSRFLLALKVCLVGGGPAGTLMFDEIDRGVGGATADAVGRRLVELAKTAQVVVVTHSPQVAALGSHHWRVAKSVKNDQTTTDVAPLGTSERVDEIARMLAGDTVTAQARAAAEALLAG
jgi:DNA repair protein RecN (Recombination protein N)